MYQSVVLNKLFTYGIPISWGMRILGWSVGSDYLRTAPWSISHIAIIVSFVGEISINLAYCTEDSNYNGNLPWI
jgi:hypothetical protein